MSNQHNDESIEKILSEMPKINDERSFDDYYQKISKELNGVNRETPKKRKKGWFFPVITSAAAICIAVMIGFQFINSNESADQMQIQNSEESSHNDMDQGNTESTEEAEEEGQFAKPKDEAEIMDSTGPKLLYENEIEGQDLQRVTFIIPEQEIQYFIPMTYLISSEQDPYAFFNNTQDTFGQYEDLNQYIINHIEYVGSNNESEPIIQVTESNMQGSASEVALFETLKYFESLGHTTVELQDEEGQTLNLPNTGSVDEHSFENQKYAYKLYHTSSGNTLWARKRLNHDIEIHEALSVLQTDEDNLNVSSPIPSEIEIEVIEENQQLEINIHSELPLSDQSLTQRIIESILLTAGSLGYEQVLVSNLDIDAVGPYNLNEPIDIPEYINVQ